MTTTPNLELPYLENSQANAELYHNEALNIVDILLSRGLVSRSTTSPPAHSDGIAYLVPTGATGDWSGQAGKVAASWGSAWVFYDPKDGWSAWVVDENVTIIYRGGWKTVTGEALFFGRNTADVNLGASTQDIPWNAFDRKDAGVFSHSTGTNPDRIVVLEAGDYLIHYDATLAFVSSARTATLDVSKNGSLVTGSESTLSVTSALSNECASGVVLVNCAVNDILRVRVTSDGTGSKLVGGKMRVLVRRV